MLDSIAAGGLVARETGPERTGQDDLAPTADVPAPDERMECRELADEMAEKIVELIPVADPLDEGTVAGQEAVVVDVVEVPVVKIVPLHPPGVDVHLTPLLARVDRKGPSRKIDSLSLRFGGAAGPASMTNSSGPRWKRIFFPSAESSKGPTPSRTVLA